MATSTADGQASLDRDLSVEKATPGEQAAGDTPCDCSIPAESPVILPASAAPVEPRAASPAGKSEGGTSSSEQDALLDVELGSKPGSRNSLVGISSCPLCQRPFRFLVWPQPLIVGAAPQSVSSVDASPGDCTSIPSAPSQSSLSQASSSASSAPAEWHKKRERTSRTSTRAPRPRARGRAPSRGHPTRRPLFDFESDTE